MEALWYREKVPCCWLNARVVAREARKFMEDTGYTPIPALNSPWETDGQYKGRNTDRQLRAQQSNV
jgi:hypothetical protein